MKGNLRSILAAACAVLPLLSLQAERSLHAQEYAADPAIHSNPGYAGKGGTGGMDDNCCRPCLNCSGCKCGYAGAGFYVLGEATFFKYGRADGTRVGEQLPEENAEFDYNAAPRITFGYTGEGGGGTRLRYWDYNQTEITNAGPDAWLSVDTYTIDWEVYQRYCLGECSIFEISGGIRYNSFRETMVDTIGGSEDLRINEFHGAGGLVDLELQRWIGERSSLFVTARGAILMDDKFIFNRDGGFTGNDEVLLDSVQGMLEIALGYQYSITTANNNVIFARASVEWQNWFNYSSSFARQGSPSVLAGLDEDIFVAPADVGFFGYVFGVGVLW